MKNEQLSFLTTEEIIIIRNKYDATICDRCCCNCDECFYYGMDNEDLSTNKVKFKCDKFELSNYYKELEVKKRRKSFKII